MHNSRTTALTILFFTVLLIWPCGAFAERFEGEAKQKIAAGDTASAQRDTTHLAKIDALLNAAKSMLPEGVFNSKKNTITRFVSRSPNKWISSYEVLDEGVEDDFYTMRIACDVRVVALRVALDEKLSGVESGQQGPPEMSQPGPVLVLIVRKSGMNPEPLWDLHQPVETYLSEQGFQIIGRDEQMKALGSESLDDALRGEPGKFCTVARVLGARYVLVGLASGNIADADGVPCIREVQVRFVHTPTTRVISAVSARPGDLTGRCQERLDLVGRALAQRVLDDQKRLADADGSGVLVEISGIRHFDDLKDLIQSLSEVPGVSSVSIEYASTGRSMGLRLLGDVRPEMLGNALNGAVMPHFRVGLEGVEGNRVRVKCIY